MKIPTFKKSDLAKFVGISRNVLFEFENGRRDTSYYNKLKISQFIKIKIKECNEYLLSIGNKNDKKI